MEKPSSEAVVNLRHLDFLTSICLMLISLFIVGDSLIIHQNVGGPVYSSPGLLPLFIGIMLMLCSVLLFFKSMKNTGFTGNLHALRDWFRPFIKNEDTLSMLKGIAIIAIYSFILVPRLPFLLSSIIFMIFLMKILDAGSYLKITLISVTLSATLFILFEIVFKVPLP